MGNTLLQAFIDWTGKIGLHYEFLSSGYEAQIWRGGFITTLYLIVLLIPVSLAFGLLFAAMLTSSRKLVSAPVRAFIEITRNTPTLVQLMFSFLVLNTLVSNVLGGAQNNPLSPFFWVVAVVGLHVAALHADAIRAGIEAVPEQTVEAARAIGFSRLQILRFVEAPLAIRASLPALVNNLINLVKLTTVGNAIAVSEITYASIMVWTQRDNVVELMIVILLFFSAINLAVARIGHWVEKRLAVPGFGVGS
ncbi:amino acid ABC transporter permease [Agrobacterium sp. SHOUNA12C]|uniref:amino acid ABC transporter permease n=1 Tax=Rhizobium rhizogenes TaxID=359 RepID=UPI001239D316|nr:amino acid ABC transporter permease [Rhizobium rhizogenes]KAA6488564.1 amino acid ABC transporter permease [Agrobacterium sp. ICMP 7243]MCJ9721857.1 amino acid ABC transporter permease [Agrobacterium sp. BETTINA12B]MCJ9756437.1 amino acid ABC transporter permease [Agrobacterium sp. SHOUNA12C]NTF52178.1 amino acid ABC transporter permease [Rhizobium rhizogenes]NTG17722.1 amino acid ABC transporter permease [Rhizobium rhizogenes]